MAKSNSNTILVTGGMGYIGSHAVLDLISSGYNVVILDSLENSKASHLSSIKGQFSFYKGKIENSKLVSKIIKDESISCVMHFAAYAYVGESIQDPMKYYKNNTSNAISLIDTCIKEKVNKFIFSSTCATYGIPDKIPITENTPQNPINPYGMSKLMIEKVLKDSHQKHSLNAIIFRYFNAGGADKDLLYGEDHNPETHLIPLLLKSILNPKFTFTVNGNKYKTKDGTCIRDFIHVTDIARAHVLGMEKLFSNKTYFNEFNLGNGKGFSVMEVLNAVEKVTKKKVKFKIGDSRPGDPPILISSAKKAEKELGWTPKFTNIESIVSSAYSYHQAKNNL